MFVKNLRKNLPQMILYRKMNMFAVCKKTISKDCKDLDEDEVDVGRQDC